MKSGRRLIRIAAVIAVALGAGHIAQSDGNGAARVASVLPGADLPNAKAITPMPRDAHEGMHRPDPDLMESRAPIVPKPARRPEILSPARLEVPGDARAAVDCTPRLGLAARPGAMIDLLLMAPCRKNERIVLRHAGLAVTYRTNGAGALFASVPALTDAARVSVLFAGGDTIEAEIALPEATAHRRVGVQWLGPQVFALNAFEEGADYGQTGHVSARRPQAPAETLLPQRGFLTALGDDAVETPMLAEIYTFPAGSGSVPVVIEAAVTTSTCSKEVLGEILSQTGSRVQVSDLSVTMPGCDAVGDYLVLKNLLPDLKLASAE